VPVQLPVKLQQLNPVPAQSADELQRPEEQVVCAVMQMPLEQV
jgi:hypothetical protein